MRHPQVSWVPDIGLISSSIDSSIKIYDFVREKVSLIGPSNEHNALHAR